MYYKCRLDFDNVIISGNTTGYTLGFNELQFFSGNSTTLTLPLYHHRYDGKNIVTTTQNVIDLYERYVSLNAAINNSSDAKYILTVLTGTTFPSTYQTKSTIYFYTGVTVPFFYQTRTSINTLTGSTLPTTYALKSNFNTFSGTTVPNTYHTKSAFNSFTGTTLPTVYQSKSTIATYTGTTAPGQFASKTNFNTFTGTTVPNTYHTKAAFNSFTGTTLPANYQSHGSILTYTGTTAPAQFQSHSSVVTLTGTTLPATYATKVNFNSFTGTTAPATYALKTNFNTFTGTTVPNTYFTKTNFNSYTASTTNVTSANNGLTKTGNNVRLGGSLTGNTTITTATGSRLNFAGFPVQYTSDLSANYNTRSFVDYGWVTANTQSTIIFKNNAAQLNTPPTEFTTINFSSGTTLVNRGSNLLEVKIIHGSEVFNTGRTTTQTTTSTTFGDYLAKTFTLAGGTYKIEYICKIGNSTANVNVGTQLLVDGVAVDSGTNNAYRITNAAARIMNSLFTVQTLSAGAHNFKIQINTSSGTASAEYGWILITRIA